MPKLLVHLVTAFLIIGGGRWLGVPMGGRLGLVVLGAFAVHFIWERLFPNPFLYLGARPIAPDDPVLVDARARARDALPRLHELFPQHPKDTIVRFRFAVPAGQDEFLWGDLLQLGAERTKVFLRTPPKQRVSIPDRTMEIPTSAIDDWQIELQDGSLLGGYTNQALFKVYEREEGHLHPAFHEQVARFRDRLDGTKFAGVTWRTRKKDV